MPIKALLLAAVILLPVQSQGALHFALDNVFWFPRDALKQLGSGKSGKGVCFRAGPRFQTGRRARITLFGEIQYQDYGDIDGNFRYFNNSTSLTHKSSPWLLFEGAGAALEWQFNEIVLAVFEVSGGRMEYSAPLRFSYTYEYVLNGQEPDIAPGVSFEGDGHYVQAGAGMDFRLWRKGRHSGKPGTAELLLRFRYAVCRGSDIECVGRESFRSTPQVPFSFESETSPLEQTQFRAGLGFAF